MATTARKQAPRLARPAGRYWKGKAPKGAADLPSDESDDEREVPQEEGDVAFAGEQEFLHAEYDDDDDEEQGRKGHRTGTMSVALKNVNISKEGKVIIAGRQEVGRTEMEGAFSRLRSLPIITITIENYPRRWKRKLTRRLQVKIKRVKWVRPPCYISVAKQSF